MASRAFADPAYRIKENYLKIDKLVKELENSITSRIRDNKIRMVEVITRLDMMSPLKTLSRGYGIIEKDKSVIKSIKDLKTDDIVQIRLTDGNVDAKIL